MSAVMSIYSLDELLQRLHSTLCRILSPTFHPAHDSVNVEVKSVQVATVYATPSCERLEKRPQLRAHVEFICARV